MTVESENYKLEILEYAVNQSIDCLLPNSSEDALNLILNRCNELVWKIATDTYSKSGYQIDFLFVKNILNLRIEPLRNRIIQEERIKKAQEVEKAKLQEQRRIKEAEEARSQANLEAERLVLIAEQQRIKEENLQAFRAIYPNVSVDVFLKIEELIIEELLLEKEQLITMNSILSKDLGAENLYIMEFILAIEQEFNIDIPDEFSGTHWVSCIFDDYSRLESITVREIVDIVCEKIQ